MDGDLGGFLVADFTHHDLVGIMAQDGTQAARKGEALLFIYGNLRDAAQLILDGILDGDNFIFVTLDLIDGGVKSGGFSGARGARNQDHAVGFADVAPKATSLFEGKTNHIQSQAGKFFRKRFLVEDAENSVFPVTSRHDGGAETDIAALGFHAAAAALGNWSRRILRTNRHVD